MMASSTIRQGVVGSTALSFTKSAVLETADLAGGVTGLDQTGGNDQSADDTVQNGNAQLLGHALVHAGETGAAQHDNLSQILFQSDLNYINACNKAEAELPQSAERDLLVNFVRSSERGCIKPYQKKAKAE